jgi:hypothetical protein
MKHHHLRPPSSELATASLFHKSIVNIFLHISHKYVSPLVLSDHLCPLQNSRKHTFPQTNRGCIVAMFTIINRKTASIYQSYSNSQNTPEVKRAQLEEFLTERVSPEHYARMFAKKQPLEGPGGRVRRTYHFDDDNDDDNVHDVHFMDEQGMPPLCLS